MCAQDCHCECQLNLELKVKTLIDSSCNSVAKIVDSVGRVRKFCVCSSVSGSCLDLEDAVDPVPCCSDVPGS